MKFLYVAPRFHPNQYPIVSGLMKKGHEVMFCVSRVGTSEKHENIEVVVLPPSDVSVMIEDYFRKKSDVLAESRMIFWFVPKIKMVEQIFDEYKPDVVIIREKNILSLIFYRMAKKRDIKVILYDQLPIYTKQGEKNVITPKSLIKGVWNEMFPKIRITVVNYESYPFDRNGYIKDARAFFLPFVPRQIINYGEKKYCAGNRVNIFACGKYRNYKNHMLLLEAINLIYNQGYNNFFVTIVGQAINEEEKQYYANLEKYISENKLSRFVDLKLDVPYDEIENYYMKNDIFVLSSGKELANVSVLDSMSYALSTISTSANGTADYIRDNETGYIFKTKDAIDLSEKIKKYIDNPELIIQHGQAALNDIKENYSFEHYYEKLLDVVQLIE